MFVSERLAAPQFTKKVTFSVDNIALLAICNYMACEARVTVAIVKRLKKVNFRESPRMSFCKVWYTVRDLQYCSTSLKSVG